MAFKLNYLQVTIVQVAPIWMFLRWKCEKKHLKSNLNIKGSRDRKRENKIAIQTFGSHQHVLWLFRQNDYDGITSSTREKGCKSVNEVKKNITQTKNTQMCEKKNVVFIDGKMCQCRAFTTLHCNTMPKDLSTEPIPQNKEHDAEKIHGNHKHTIHQAKKFQR